MLKTAAKVVAVVATSAVAIPYTVAFVCNVLYGWPQQKYKYRRAFHPRKVYALNWAILQQLRLAKYLKLYFKYKHYYRVAPATRLIKDIPFGTNENKLDIHLPEGINPDIWCCPVIVFVYGGTWSSGDKSMYGLLCSELANNLQAVVCCPNYSLYPKGYVDDQIQDIVDCVTWIHNNGSSYGADVNHITLVGHSAGAHLCAMATLELTMSRLIHNPRALILPETVVQESQTFSIEPESIHFVERYFDGSNGEASNGEGGEETPLMQSLGTDSAPITGSFYVIGNGNERERNSSGNSDSFIVVDQTAEEQAAKTEDKAKEPEVGTDEPDVSEQEAAIEKEADVEAETQKEASVEADTEKEVAEEKEVTSDVKEKGGGDAPEETKVKEVVSPEMASAEKIELIVEDEEDTLTRSQKEIRDILGSIKNVIGLSGVYDIADHYMHEAGRGVEDVSSMGKAMYGPEHFNRFSPTKIVKDFPPRTKLPAITLVHGSADIIVPLSASSNFAMALTEMGGARVTQIIIPGADHYSVCLDINDPKRDLYDCMMQIIRRQIQLTL